MVTHPIHVKRINYSGSNLTKRKNAEEKNRIAGELERHINKMLESQKTPIQTYRYYDIARATGYSEDIVRELCFIIDCGNSGFTAIRADLSYDEAMALHRQDI